MLAILSRAAADASAADAVLQCLIRAPAWGLVARRRGYPMTDAKGVPIRRLNPPELGSPPGYSQIVEVRASRIVFIAGQTALDRDGVLVGKNDFAAQAEQVFRNLGIALETVGCTASDLVKLTVFLRDMGQLAAYREARNRFFATVTPPAAPAVTLVEVSKLYGPDFLIEIEAVAASAP
jgi:enamine deaminase RidA (YjgF/YER057c/UK114 family)